MIRECEIDDEGEDHLRQTNNRHFAGSPAANARVRNICPTLAVRPTPSKRAIASG